MHEYKKSRLPKAVVPVPFKSVPVPFGSVPVPFGSVPVPTLFCKLVPVPHCLGTSTTLVLVSGIGTTLIGTDTILHGTGTILPLHLGTKS